MDSTRGVLRFIAWLGVICASLETAHFGFRFVSELQLIVVLSQRHELLMLVRFGGRIVLEGLSILLLVGCIGLLQGRANARTFCMTWALCTLAVGLSIELAVIARGWRTIHEAGLWLTQTLMDWLIQSGLPLTLLSILSIPQIVTALKKPRGFEVLQGGGVIPVFENESYQDNDFEVDQIIARRISMVGIILGSAGTVCLIMRSLGHYFGILNHGISGKWRDPGIIFFDWATLVSFVVLLFGAIRLFLNKKSGRKIIVVWAIAFVICSVGTAAFYRMPIAWWNATQVRIPVTYIVGDFIFAIYDGLQLCAFAIITAMCLRKAGQSEVQTIESTGH